MQDPSTRPMAPPTRPFSILPAAVVLIAAVVTLGAFAVVDVVASPTTTATTVPNIVVGGLKSDPHTTVFAHWFVNDLPPANISSALVVPVATRFVTSVNTGGGIDYDLEVRLSAGAPRDQLLGFYRSNLVALGWKVISVGGAPHGGQELIFQKAGTNGLYWEAGVTAQATASGRTTYTFRLFDVSDSE